MMSAVLLRESVVKRTFQDKEGQLHGSPRTISPTCPMPKLLESVRHRKVVKLPYPRVLAVIKCDVRSTPMKKAFRGRK
jgi:hypothetical protein